MYYGGFNQALAWGSQAGAHAAAFNPEGAKMEEATGDGNAAPAAAAVSDATYQDGSYQAAHDGKEGPVPVTVTVSGGKIASVEIGDNNETAGIGSQAIDALPAAIVAANGADVDAISGATMTSDAIIAGVQECLEQAA